MFFPLQDSETLMKRRKRTRTERSLKIESLEIRQLMAADLLAGQAEPLIPDEGPTEVRTFENVAEEITREFGMKLKRIPGFSDLEFKENPFGNNHDVDSDFGRVLADWVRHTDAENRYLDGNGDGFFTAADVLKIINVLNQRSGHPEIGDDVQRPATDRLENDLTLDGTVSPIDALVAIDHLNQRMEDAKSGLGTINTRPEPCDPVSRSLPDVRPSKEEKEAKELLEKGKAEEAADKFQEAAKKRIQEAMKRNRKGDKLGAAQLMEKAGEDYAAEQKVRENAGLQPKDVTKARTRAAESFALAASLYEQAATRALQEGKLEAVGLASKAAKNYKKAADQLDDKHADERKMKERFRHKSQRLISKVNKFLQGIGAPQEMVFQSEDLETMRCYLHALPETQAISVRDLIAAPTEGGRGFDPIGREMDWGDAPDSYATTLTEDGPRHLIIPGIRMGALIDGEYNGLPDPQAKGDDNWIVPFFNDEDGVVFTNPLVYGQAADIQVTVSVPGYLDAWFDFNADGTFTQAGDQIFASQQLMAGVNNLSFNLPGITPLANQTFSRFRFSTQGGLSHDGPAPSGEVEDYVVNTVDRPRIEMKNLDWGDAPDSYDTTMMKNGPRHKIVQGIQLGQKIDGEVDGQPGPLALNDDNNGFGVFGVLGASDDEDGVVFTSPLVYGSIASVQVTASVPGFLDAWFDFNANGQFDLPFDQVFTKQPLGAGLNNLSFNMADVIPNANSTFARFRYSTTGGLRSTGAANDGEVEDYFVTTISPDGPQLQWDYGDAPESYKTLLVDDGARHVVMPGLHLGLNIDTEVDGQPNGHATGDDVAVFDDEDGVTFVSPVHYGQVATIEVVASAAGKLDAWLDFDDDGSFDEPIDRIFESESLVAGVNTLTINMPGYPQDKLLTFARFRLSSDGGLDPTGPAVGGEVEDYPVEIRRKPLPIWDFGDAPDSYGTLLASDGARHGMMAGFHLGSNIDPEADGHPNPHATGDDLAAVDDEDGVTFVSSVHYGQTVTIEVVASAAGKLDAWLDFNDDGSFNQPGDQIFNNQQLVAGVNVLAFAMPNLQQAELLTMARFRFSTVGGLTPTGVVDNGEVEDYPVMIRKKSLVKSDYGDAPDSYGTLLASNGARHIAIPGLHLGATLDTEVDGQPAGQANGDDVAGVDDEDGVTFVTAVVLGQPATIQLVASAAGKLDAWLDFAGDGNFLQPMDQIFNNQPVVAGLNTLTFVGANPSVALFNFETVARFRISSAGGLPFNGLAADGEVEDYAVAVSDRPPPPGEPIFLSHRGGSNGAGGSSHQEMAADRQSLDGAEGEEGPAVTSAMTNNRPARVAHGRAIDGSYRAALLNELVDEGPELDLSFVEDAVTENSIDQLMATVG